MINKNIALIATGLFSIIISGCVSYQEKAIAPNKVAESWKVLGPEEATKLYDQNLRSSSSSYNLNDGISLREAEVTALFYNPTLSTSRIRSGLPDVQKKYAKLWDDPELEVDGEYFSSKDDNPLNFTSGLSITIPLSGRLDVQREIAKESLTASKASLLAEEWALVVEIRQRWIERLFLSEKVLAIKDIINDHEEAIKLVPHYRAAKVATIIDEQNLLIEKEELEDDLRLIQLEIRQNKLTLLSLMGLHPDANWKLIIDREVIDRAIIFKNEKKDWLSYPEIQKILSQYEIAQLRLKLAIRRQVPDLKLGLGAGREEGESLMAFGLGLTHVPFFNKNSLEISETALERKAHSEEVLNSIQVLVNKRASAKQQLEISIARVSHMENKLLPLVEKQLTDAKRLTKLGELDLYLLVEAIQKKGEIKLNFIEALSEQSYANLQSLALSGPDFNLISTENEDLNHNNER